jgi:hypothetical protein
LFWILRGFDRSIPPLVSLSEVERSAGLADRLKAALKGPEARALWAKRRRLLIALGVFLAIGTVMRCRAGGSEDTLEASVAAAFAHADVTVDPGSVVWLEPESSPFSGRALLALGADVDLRDVYYAEARVAGDEVLDLARVTNVTRSSGADESDLVVSGRYALFASKVGDDYEAVTILDGGGEPRSLTKGWPLRARAQNAITNYQETGRFGGLGRRRYSFHTPSRALSVRVESGRFVVTTDGGTLAIDPAEAEPESGAELAELRPAEKGMPGGIPWMVDTVRNTSFIGPEPIEWLEHRVFSLKDRLEQGYHAVFGNETAAEQEQEIAEELGVSAAERRRRIELAVTDPELGWPPRPIEVVYDEPLEGEGQWLPVIDDPFVKTYPNAPTPFYTTVFRPDEHRVFARVYIVIWDPRLVQLRIMTGTREPESATGETGPGMAPRDPQTLDRLVAGFNGGFQALHGEFGMMSEGRVYLPPKPWAATIAVHRDGRVSMGSWMRPPDGVRTFEEGWAVAQIPADMVEFRQNLTSVVEDGRYNPYERWWWGAAPLNAEEQVRIDRSGVCLTEEGFYAYFFGKSLGPEELGETMLRTRCVRAVHLDMNSRHTGFEFYDIRPEGRHPALGAELGEGRYDGELPLAPGMHLRARLLTLSMTPMRFPRYAARDPRDFFYLTLRPVLPGPDLATGVPFQTQGLPHAGFPFAFARAFDGPVGTSGPNREVVHGPGAWLVRIDPSRAVPAPIAGENAGTALAYLSNPSSSGSIALYSVQDVVGRRFAIGRPPEGAAVILRGSALDRGSDAIAAIGVDRDGFLVYAERAGEDAEPLLTRLSRAGVTDAIALGESRLAFSSSGELVAPDSFERELERTSALAFFANEAPYHSVLFPDTEPRPYSVWARMQDTRVRYEREGDPTFSRSNNGVRDETEAP